MFNYFKLRTLSVKKTGKKVGYTLNKNNRKIKN